MAAKTESHLDPRLLRAAELVRPGSIAADIGCDHGKLSIYLVKTGHCPRVIAADLRPQPLERARRNAEKAHCTEQLDFRLGSGLEVLQPGEAQDIVIAGMGAETIIEILEAALWVNAPGVNLVLVPATKHSLLRRWLARHGFALDADRLVQAAGRLYAVMQAHYTGQAFEPDGRWCITGRTEGALAPLYRSAQLCKLKKYRKGAADPAEQAGVDALIEELEGLENAED